MGTILGLSAEEETAFRAATASPGARVHSRARVLDLDHKALGDLSMLGGQVRWNRGADVVTEATVESGDDIDVRDLDLHHLVRCEMGVETTLGRLWCPTITGWVVTVTDSGPTTEYGLHDKSAMGLLDRRRQKFGPNTYVGEAVHDMFAAIGIRHHKIARRWREGGPKLGTTVHVGGHDPEKARTRMAKRLARKHGFQWYFDALGYNTWRRPPQQPSVKWADGDDSDAKLLEEVTWTRDLTTIRNSVVAKGRKKLNTPNKDKNERGPDDRGPDYRRLNEPVRADPGHRYSPRNLKQGNTGLLLQHYMDADTVDSGRELRNAAEDTLRKLLVDRADVRLRSSAVPWVYPFDLFSARRFDGPFADFTMNEGSMEFDWSDLTIGDQQTYRRRGRR